MDIEPVIHVAAQELPDHVDLRPDRVARTGHLDELGTEDVPLGVAAEMAPQLEDPLDRRIEVGVQPDMGHGNTSPGRAGRSRQWLDAVPAAADVWAARQSLPCSAHILLPGSIGPAQAHEWPVPGREVESELEAHDVRGTTNDGGGCLATTPRWCC